MPIDDPLYQQAMMLYKISFDKSARAAGGTVRFASQHSLLWGAMKQGAFIADRWKGVCAGLAIEWMKYKAQGKDFIALFYKIRNEVMGKQQGPKLGLGAFAGSVDGSHVQQNNVAGALAGILGKVGADQQISFPFSKLGSSLRGGNYFYLSSGTHAMAGRSGGTGKVDFYDPNVGEVSGTSPRFFDTYLKDCLKSTALVQDMDAAATKKLVEEKVFKATFFAPLHR